MPKIRAWYLWVRTWKKKEKIRNPILLGDFGDLGSVAYKKKEYRLPIGYFNVLFYAETKNTGITIPEEMEADLRKLFGKIKSLWEVIIKPLVDKLHQLHPRHIQIHIRPTKVHKKYQGSAELSCTNIKCCRVGYDNGI